MRRLPIFFVLDVSESMLGDNLSALQSGLSEIDRNLRNNAHALETVCISVIAFAGQARTIAPLVELETFYPPKLPIGSGTCLGAALNHLMSEIDRQVIKTIADRKGDWKPIVYLMTDGKPTDNVSLAIKKWREEYEKRATMIAIAIGQHADQTVLQRLTDTVLVFSNHQEGDFTKFIQWITASISAQSEPVDPTARAKTSVTLAKLDNNVLEFVSPRGAKPVLDPDTVVLTGRCQRRKSPYLMKFVRGNERQENSRHSYTVAGCYPVEEEYFAWSDPSSAEAASISTGDLLGGAGCPHCANPFAFAICGCGRLMCVSGEGEATCPWCHKSSSFSVTQEGDPLMNIQRGLG